jgi:hypothetical protein
MRFGGIHFVVRQLGARPLRLCGSRIQSDARKVQAGLIARGEVDNTTYAKSKEIREVVAVRERRQSRIIMLCSES